MSFKEKYRVVSRQPTLPPLSNRTLCHPSFQPLYMISGSNQTVHPIISPSEFFYTDPTSCGRRIPNLVSDLECHHQVLDCFRLNTPPPLMSACQAPPVRPDPFRSGPHPVSELGGLALKIESLHHSAQPKLLVVQLTQEEDDTVTNLLKLHHQEPVAFQPNDDEGLCWSESELEAANTLLNGFGLIKGNEMRGENNKKSSESPHLPVGSKTVPEFNTPGCTDSVISFCGELEEIGCGDFLARNRSKDLLSDSEGEAVNVLLSLGDIPISR